jgi:hypothetical protein
MDRAAKGYGRHPTRYKASEEPEPATTPCPTTKTPYPTRSVAKTEMRKHWMTGARRVYLCPWCDQYHMTSQASR